MTLIPLALGVLGLKAWNALQLSFFSFITAFSLAIFQLCKKVSLNGCGQSAVFNSIFFNSLLPITTTHKSLPTAHGTIMDAAWSTNHHLRDKTWPTTHTPKEIKSGTNC